MAGESCVNFLDYDKIADDLIWFDKDIVLRFNVKLASKTADGKRRHYLNEIQYKAKKYIDKDKVLTVRRHFDYYLSIDVRYEFESSVLIKAKDMLNVRARLKMASKWFADGIFGKDKKGKLHVVGSPRPIDITNLSGKYIRLEPAIITYDNEEQIEGVRLILNGERQVDISVDKFMELLYVINGMDMYTCAIGLVNYIRPDLGENVYDMSTYKYDDDRFSDESDCDCTIKKNYKKDKPEKTKSSFFDKLDDM